MFAKFKQLFAPKNKDLRKRILFTLAGLFIFVVGTTIVVPGVNIGDLDNLGFLELLNIMGGGALRQFSIFALGVSPYITASIVIQLLEMDIVPYFAELSKQGHTGRQKLNQITRYVGIAMAFFQGFALAYAFLDGASALMQIKVAVILTAGTAFTLWMGDQITQKGLGNGISLLIMAGIITSLPQMFIDTYNFLLGPESTIALGTGIVGFAAFILVYLIIIVGIIYIEQAERKIPIQYANKSSAALGKQTFMPIKINSAGVIPVIFASALLGVPSTIAQFVKNEGFTNFVDNYINYTSTTGLILYVLLIFFFGYFYTFMQMKPETLSKNLQDNGGYIPGVRPGKSTENYFKKIISRLTISGSFFLMLLAVLPVLVSKLSLLPNTVTLGGTGVLIVVGVAIETFKQFESGLASKDYKESYRRRRR